MSGPPPSAPFEDVASRADVDAGAPAVSVVSVGGALGSVGIDGVGPLTGDADVPPSDIEAFVVVVCVVCVERPACGVVGAFDSVVRTVTDGFDVVVVAGVSTFDAVVVGIAVIDVVVDAEVAEIIERRVFSSTNQ